MGGDQEITERSACTAGQLRHARAAPLRPFLDARSAADREGLLAQVGRPGPCGRYPALVLVSDGLVRSDPSAPAAAGLTDATRLFVVARGLRDWQPAQALPFELRPLFSEVTAALELLSVTLGHHSEFAGMPPEDILTCLVEQAGEQPFASDWCVAFEGGDACAFVLPSAEAFGTIMAIGVRPDRRNHGLGRALHRYALTVLKRRGMAEYRDHVDDGSPAMLAICDAHGCEKVGCEWQFRLSAPPRAASGTPASRPP